MSQFPRDQVYCFFDWESYSEAKLKLVGAYEYSKHPSTECLVLAWAIGTRDTILEEPVNVWAPHEPHKLFYTFLDALADPDVILVAHNAFFDRMITHNVFAEKYMSSYKKIIQSIPTKRWLCTAALAAAMAVPRSLENACEAMRLPIKKNKDGKRLIKLFCKPRKPSKKDPSTRYVNHDEFQRFKEYAADDVRAMIGLFLKANPLSKTERGNWLMDQRINLRGFAVDRPLVQTVTKMIAVEKKILDRKVERLSMGLIASANQRDAILEFLAGEGVFLPDLQKKTVDDAIEDGMATGEAEKILRIRQAVSKTSLAKYPAFDMRSASDGRLRDNIVFHAATTGRDGGSGVQPQNLPRPTIKDTITAAEILSTGDVALVRMIYGDAMQTFVNCIRNMIIAGPGTTLDVGDYASIEVRVCFWLAGDEPGLEAYRRGEDLYKKQAATVFGKLLTEILDNSFERFLGKELILGAQYGLGAKKFGESCAKKGQIVAKSLSEKAIAVYRKDHPQVVSLWKNLEKAAVNAIQNPSQKFYTNKTVWFMRNDFLYCKLPSGRELAYPYAQVQYDTDQWGRKKPTIYYWTYDTTIRKWTRIKTWGGTLANHITQGTARDLLMASSRRIEKTGIWKIVLKVHDEIVAERKAFSEGSFEKFIRIMEIVPPWAEGCPIKVEGFTGNRYRK